MTTIGGLVTRPGVLSRHSPREFVCSFFYGAHFAELKEGFIFREEYPGLLSLVSFPKLVLDLFLFVVSFWGIQERGKLSSTQ